VQGVNFHFCGASLIAPNLVLSAAHCQDAASSVRVNPHRRSRPIPVSEQFDVIQEFIHPKYSSDLFNIPYDFMILKMDGNSTQTPVRVNSNEAEPQLDDTLTAMGWGTTDADFGVFPDILHHVNVSYITNEQCEAVSLGSYDDLITDQ
jgi:trypsin